MGKNSVVLQKMLDKRLNDIAEFILARAQERVASFSDTGELLNSGYIRKEKNAVIIGFNAPHAVYVEYGSSAHMPPVEVIKAWAGRKGIASGKELNSVAWAIAKKIARDGIAPKPFLRPSVEEALFKFK